MELGQKQKDIGDLAATPTKSEEPKITYPSVTLRDDVAKEFLASYDCEIGDELTATVKMKISGLRQDQFGSSVEFEMLSLDDITKQHGESADKADKSPDKKTAKADKSEDDAEAKILGYKRPTKNPVKETPDTSAASMY